ncbi:MAG: chemotaxis protein CheW [Treponema sp.]|nr:chemotaxis protein CheW [Treponema sp.]
MNEDLINVISESQKASEAQDVEKKTTVWLIFSIAGKKYAMRSADVLEIIRDVPIYKLPFMPAYIEGVINRRGDPFTVINPLAVFGDTDAKPPEEPLFLIMKRDDDQLSVHISDILQFTEMAESDLNLIPNGGDEDFFLGTLSYGHEEVPAINPGSFELLIRKDLGSA